MKSLMEQLAAELRPALARYHPAIVPVTPYQAKRREQVRDSMRRLRAHRKQQVLTASRAAVTNGHGKQNNEQR